MREVSLPALQAMMAHATTEAFIACLKIEHPGIDTIRLCMNAEAITRIDGEYLPYGFDTHLPTLAENEIPQVTVTVDNTDLEVNDAIRTLVGTPKVTFDVVLASDPDDIVGGPYVFDLQNATGNEQTIQGALGYEQDIFTQQFPGQNYTPGNSAGLYT